ncbi:roadblock/LC7 domain-containing protein [uncultured Olleya sp.]|uniref:roadblock/LC7 domain-containing protein n=1 Tax=uncultured Olleya sp. TaxID=757243 RepID=UPI002594C93B|nr:roadblock/LC7 domain-containing protein [uncultured Olleya sp.]
MINIKEIIEDTGAKIAVLADKEGKVIESVNTEYADNIALMTETSLSMCNDLINDITKSKLNQLIIRSENEYIVINKLQSENFILVVSDNASRFGLLLKQMNSLQNK